MRGQGGEDALDGHRPELDGLRAVAVGLVLWQHLVDPHVQGGFGMAGVTLFFVLSGYLITTLLVRERTKHGRLDLRQFYLRRVVRLAPALLLILVVVSVVGVIGLWPMPWRPGVIAAFADVSNIALLNGVDTGPMGHAWSLSIEEQFYLLWPWILALMPARPIALVGMVIGLGLYAAQAPGAYFSTVTNAGALLAGCSLALWPASIPGRAGVVGFVLVAVGVAARFELLVVLGALAIIGSRSTLLAPMASAGRRAYSVYLWNWPMTLLFGPVGLPLTLAAAECSYRFVERPILARFHDQLRPRPRSATAVVPDGAAVLLSSE